MTDNPYKVVIEALAKQSVAIGRLAAEIKTEFVQYKNAVEARDTARANSIAAAIEKRTNKLVEAADALAASVPDAGADQDLPGGGGGSIDNTLPEGERPTDPGYGQDAGPGIDNTLPGRDRPTDPGYGQSNPVRPDQGLPPSGGRPDQGLPGRDRPVDPGYGQGAPNRPDAGLPEGRPERPDQGLPGKPPGTSGEKPDTPDQKPPAGGGSIDNTLPETPDTKPVDSEEGEKPEPKSAKKKGFWSS